MSKLKTSLRGLQLLVLIIMIVFIYYSNHRMGFMRFTYFINHEIEIYLNLLSIKLLLSLSIILILYKFILKNKESVKVGYLFHILLGVIILLSLFKFIFLGDMLHEIVTVAFIMYLYIEFYISMKFQK